MGWNFVLQIARYNQAIVVTRKNNGKNIRAYIGSHPEERDLFSRIRFLYFDWPFWLRWWKKGPLLSMIYFYGWQLTLAIWLLFKRIPVDVVHNLNFHNDWTPSFLWMLRKPVVWGPVGHHPKIPQAYLLPVYGRAAYRKDRLLWRIKQFFWHADPFLRMAARKADMIICMNSEAPERLHVREGRYRIMPSVASGDVALNGAMRPSGFTVLSAGRFVPLKGFDLAIRSFACFYHQLAKDQQCLVKLILAGSGPQLPLLQRIIAKEKIEQSVEIVSWIPKDEMKNVYESAQVFLFPSHEGAGMVVAEAMSHGLPVICLDNSGPGEFVHPESTLKVGYGRYETTVWELADKLKRLYWNPEYYQQERRFALRRFNDCFRWDIRGEQLQEIYAALCNE
jgi:glycosyltransferase involved in cell wall biosynthesis